MKMDRLPLRDMIISVTNTPDHCAEARTRTTRHATPHADTRQAIRCYRCRHVTSVVDDDNGGRRQRRRREEQWRYEYVARRYTGDDVDAQHTTYTHVTHDNIQHNDTLLLSCNRRLN